MGQVWKARDTRLDRIVAVKVSQERFSDRFEREARTIAALSHPHICTLFDVGPDYLVMEYLEGRTLRGPLPLKTALQYAVQAAEALHAAHARGVIHRDLKPGNILVTKDGIKLLDFGLAKVAAQSPVADLTATIAEPLTKENSIVGTLQYMAPEQLEGKPADARSDIFAFGLVLYEAITGKAAFQASSQAGLIAAILKEEPKPVGEFVCDASPELEQIIHRCLRKNREERYQSSSALLKELEACSALLSSTSLGGISSKALLRQIRRPKFLLPALALAGALVFLGVKGYQRYADTRWAAAQALPEITRLIGLDRIGAAYQLAVKAEKYLPHDAMLEKLWPTLARSVTIETTPAGAEIFRKDYDTPDAPWERAGRSPMKEARAPRSWSRWRIEKRGYLTVEGLLIPNPFAGAVAIRIQLDEEGKAPPGMVRVPGQERLTLDITGFEALPEMRLDDFWIDRYEVANKQFKQFVDAGGYQKREYWKQPFRRVGRVLPWEEAMAQFRDATGRPGPAGWQQGDYPAGQADYPVNGVSWYEAAAYAEFAGKSLPTIWQWNQAAGIRSSAAVVPASNFGGPGPAPVGKFLGLGPWGAYDMAGNVKEWCWNQGKPDQRYILGGGWDEPVYMFTDADARSPFDRASNFGFRCVKYISSAEPGGAADPVLWPARDYSQEKPCSDALFRVYKSLYAYDKTPLNAKVESVEETPEYRRERISFDAAYGKERVIAYLYLPNGAKPPLQTIVYFPGSGVIQARTLPARYLNSFDFLLKSGRAVMFPIYKGTLERGDDLTSDYPSATASYRDHVIAWSKDLGRSIDYLETRPEIDRAKLAYMGFSWGAALGPIMTAVEERIKVNLLVLPGFYLQKSLPEVDQLNFAPRVKIPTLMLSGRFDFFYPVETSQLPLFRLLGTPQENKRHVTYDVGHNIPRNELIKETLDWLDRYLGPPGD